MIDITVFIRADTVFFGTVPHDKRKPTAKVYENSPEGFKLLRADLNKVISDESQRIHESQPIHVFHSEVHKIV